MSKKSQRPFDWTGRAALAPGMGVFKGWFGDNQTHRHWAHQITVGLGTGVEVCSEGATIWGQSLFIPAGTPHRLAPGPVLSIHLDPTAAVSRALCEGLGAAGAQPAERNRIFELPSALTALLCTCFSDGRNLRLGIADLQRQLHARPDVRPSEKLQSVLQALEAEMRTQTVNRRSGLASLVGLSESRFSHWFREQTGMPLRSYRKWLRLIVGLEHVLKGLSLTGAAHAAQFSDQAHFTRTFVQMFGVRPSEALPQVRLDDWAPE